MLWLQTNDAVLCSSGSSSVTLLPITEPPPSPKKKSTGGFVYERTLFKKMSPLKIQLLQKKR
jgi:hypothetical protein